MMNLAMHVNWVRQLWNEWLAILYYMMLEVASCSKVEKTKGLPSPSIDAAKSSFMFESEGSTKSMCFCAQDARLF